MTGSGPNSNPVRLQSKKMIFHLPEVESWLIMTYIIHDIINIWVSECCTAGCCLATKQGTSAFHSYMGRWVRTAPIERTGVFIVKIPDLMYEIPLWYLYRE